MTAIFAWWASSAVVLVALGLVVGFLATGRLLGLLIDSRGRYSLTHLQLSLWTFVILSLVAGVFFGRWQHNVDPLGFSIPSVVLALLGISVGSAVTVTAAKTAKSTTRPANTAAAVPAPVAAGVPGSWRPSLLQVFLLEEGTYADQVVDITKFQNFVITIVLVLGYIGLAVHSITAAGAASKVTALPAFSGTFLVLLGISHAGYLAGKLPSPGGQPAGLTVASREAVAWAATRSAAAAGSSTSLRRGQLWRNAAMVTTWSDSTQSPKSRQGARWSSPTRVRSCCAGLRRLTGNRLHDTIAVPAGGGLYAVMLTPADLASGAAVQFARLYLDRSAGGAPMTVGRAPLQATMSCNCFSHSVTLPHHPASTCYVYVRISARTRVQPGVPVQDSRRSPWRNSQSIRAACTSRIFWPTAVAASQSCGSSPTELISRDET